MPHGSPLSPPSPLGEPMPQDGRTRHSWDLFSQLLRTRQWEADANQLRRPADVHAWAAAEAAPQ